MNSKSEHAQLRDYINKGNVSDSRYKDISRKKKKTREITKVEIDSRLKNFFNIGNIQTSELFNTFVKNSLQSDITDELSFEKSFFTCSEVIGCHRNIYYEVLNYKINISDNYLKYYKKYLVQTNYRNALLELCNFENNQIIIDHNNKIKDIIPAIQNNIMIDFECIPSNDDVYRLKALIYNRNKSFESKIKQIKVIKFSDGFDNLKIHDIVMNDENLLDKFSSLQTHLDHKKLPDIFECEQCNRCLFHKYCFGDIGKEIKIEKKKEINRVVVGKKQPVLKNTFLM